MPAITGLVEVKNPDSPTLQPAGDAGSGHREGYRAWGADRPCATSADGHLKIAFARLSLSSSETPEGFSKRSISALFSAGHRPGLRE